MASAIVTNIQGYSIHDGPGIRTVVFLKGCPLRCRWCANPENLTGGVQIGFIKTLCTGCGRCAKACTHGAIRPGNCYRIDQAACTRCGDCVERCFYDALVRYGTEETAQSVFEKVRRDKMFYDQSGGGVTLSGGEALSHPEFACELLALCRADGIHTCVETCGYVPQETIERVLPLTDLFYYDLKLMDPEAHKAYTGADNRLILDNAAFLVKSGAQVLFRQPLIPGVNDTGENIRATVEFMKKLGRGGQKLQLIPYHRAGTSKYEALNLPYTLEELQIMPSEQVEAVRQRYCELGVSCTISQ